MKPLFTIHEGEFLVGDHINRGLGRKYDVWVPTKDSGVDLLVTRKRRQGSSVGLQVKFSRGFSVRGDMARHMLAIGWYKLDPQQIRKSQADLWVFVILTLKHEEHFVLIPTRELRKRIPHGSGRYWHLYLSIFDDGSCYQIRGLNKEEQLDLHGRGVRDRHRDLSEWLEHWKLLDRLTKNAR